MAKEQSLQDRFLQALKTNRTGVTVFLVNGFQIRGVVTDFDSFVLFLLADGRQEMIYKHAISTIMPVNAVSL